MAEARVLVQFKLDLERKGAGLLMRVGAEELEVMQGIHGLVNVVPEGEKRRLGHLSGSPYQGELILQLYDLLPFAVAVGESHAEIVGEVDREEVEQVRPSPLLPGGLPGGRVVLEGGHRFADPLAQLSDLFVELPLGQDRALTHCHWSCTPS